MLSTARTRRHRPVATGPRPKVVKVDTVPGSSQTLAGHFLRIGYTTPDADARDAIER